MRNIHIAACLSVIAMLSAPASAQSLAELDRLSDLTANEETGVAAAQEQAGRGAYLEALSTLERVMAAFPESVSARLLHAVYLCRIDDRQGGLVEISQMDEDLFGAANIADARDRCSRPYVEPQAPAPAPVARPDPEPIETVALPPSTAAGGTVSGKEQPAPVAPPPDAPAATTAGTNSISGSNAISDTAPPRSSSSSSSQQPEDTSGGEKD